MTTTSPNTDGQPLTWAVDEALPEDPHREDIDGGLWWATPQDEGAARARHTMEVEHGYDSHLVRRGDLAGHGVARGPADEFAVHNPGEGWALRGRGGRWPRRGGESPRGHAGGRGRGRARVRC